MEPATLLPTKEGIRASWASGEEVVQRLETMADSLLRAPYRAVGPREPDRVMGEIVIDSLTPVALGIISLNNSCHVVDVGCGSGIPILPLAVVLKRARLTGVDSSSKRLAFAAALATALSLDNVDWMQMHVKPPKRDLKRRIIDGDFVVARGLARLEVAIPTCELFRKPGGSILISTTESALKEFLPSCGRNAIVHPYRRPGVDTPYALLEIKD